MHNMYGVREIRKSRQVNRGERVVGVAIVGEGGCELDREGGDVEMDDEVDYVVRVSTIQRIASSVSEGKCVLSRRGACVLASTLTSVCLEVLLYTCSEEREEDVFWLDAERVIHGVDAVLVGRICVRAQECGVNACLSYRSVFPGSLDEYIPDGTEKKPSRRTDACGLELSVFRVHRQMKKVDVDVIEDLSPVYLTAVLEFIIREIILLATPIALKDGRSLIEHKDIIAATNKLHELSASIGAHIPPLE